jgi:hypothetical protein
VLASGSLYADTPAKDAPAKKAPATSETSDADAQKFLVFWDKLVDIVVADKDDCGKMGKDINSLIDASTELLKMAKDAADKGKELPKSAKDHMMASMQKLMGGMQKCQNDKTVQAAFQRLDFGKKKSGK